MAHRSVVRCALIAFSTAALAFLPMGCMDGPSTETGNPNLRGSLVDSDGRPTAGTVKLFKLQPAANADSAALKPPILLKTYPAGADGKFHFDSLPPAQYALEGSDASARTFSLAPGLALLAAKDTLQRTLILKAPARLVGTVTRGPNALPAGVIGNAQILARVGGADRFAYSDSAGRFALENVPEGVYRIAFAAADGHYEPAFLDGVRAESGVTLEIPTVELAWSRFQPPPAPTGLIATLDSANGTIRLQWRSVKLANLAFYEVTRGDSLAIGNSATFRTNDTVYLDTVKALPAGHTLIYRIAAVNALGIRSIGPAQARPIVVPIKPDTGAKSGFLAGLVRYKTAPLAGAKVMMYAVPAAPGSPDSLPIPAKLLDSAVTGLDGRYRFRGLLLDSSAGIRYTVIASQGDPVSGNAAARIGLAPRTDSAALDTLDPLQRGSVTGRASRDSLWVSAPFKGDENIPVSLAGAPFATFTTTAMDQTGALFSLSAIPPGRYKLVIQATPVGYFLPDTLDVTVAPGAATTLPAPVKARYNPSAPPPKIASLQITSSSRATVKLAWTGVYRYAPLKGYRVLRLDAELKESARSEVINATTWSDDVSALPSGSKWSYVARVVNQAGMEGANGGDGGGQPIPFIVP